MIMRSATGWLALLIGFVLTCLPARAEKLVLTVSDDTIEVTSSFSGAGIALLGSIQRDSQTVSRQAGYDIVIAVRGPKENIVTRKRERVAGIWVNRSSVRYYGVPSLYIVSSTRPLEDIASPGVLARESLGLANAAGQTLSRASEADLAQFREATIRLKEKEGLYVQETGKVAMIGGTLFRTRIDLPANMRTGHYEATVYLFSGGALVAQDWVGFYAAKRGFEATVSDLAQYDPLTYGIIAVVLAAMTGWVGAFLFRRD
ncbi:MAG: TIGR02186 family protein [Rhodobiaceae bacterium]|nr:TIGR02186 family protein [Rhodobiaceae bacterium]MCC0055081.1 TIGR02186 family protein [Rhodobiaceae bacterium]